MKMTKDRLLTLVNYKGCEVCGKQPQNLKELHFHHLGSRTKKHNIADMYNYSDEAILKEAKKCKVICKDCHKALHKALGKKVTIMQSKSYIKDNKVEA